MKRSSAPITVRVGHREFVKLNVTMARSLWERLSPEPNQVNVDKLCLKRFYSLNIPKSFIHCRQDKALPPGYFHPRMSSRLRAFKLVEMWQPRGHVYPP
jgi:hypothetical protein